MKLAAQLSVLAAVLAVASMACTADKAASPGATSTITPGVSPRAPDDQWATRMAQCMKDKGWDVKVHADGGLEANYPTDQTDRYEEDKDRCYADTGYSRGSPEMTAERAGRLYDELIKVADCVRALGYEVSEPPSKQAYVEGLMNKQLPWHPYSKVFEVGPNDAAQRKLNDECPIREPA